MILLKYYLFASLYLKMLIKSVSRACLPYGLKLLLQMSSDRLKQHIKNVNYILCIYVYKKST